MISRNTITTPRKLYLIVLIYYYAPITNILIFVFQYSEFAIDITRLQKNKEEKKSEEFPEFEYYYTGKVKENTNNTII